MVVMFVVEAFSHPQAALASHFDHGCCLMFKFQFKSRGFWIFSAPLAILIIKKGKMETTARNRTHSGEGSTAQGLG